MSDSPDPVPSAPDKAQSAPDPAQSAPDPAQSTPDPAQSTPDPAQPASDPAQPASDPLQSALAQSRKRDQRVLLYGLLGIPLVVMLAAFGYAMTRGMSVVILPPEAAASGEVAVINGWGVSMGMSIYPLWGPQQIRVASAGFFPVTLTVPAGAANSYREVILQPQPAVVFMSTNTSDMPQAAQNLTHWRVNSLPRGTGAELTVELPAGTNRVEVSHPWFTSAGQILQLARGEERQLQLPMTKVQGTLEIASEPSGATVTLNNKVAGTTPLQLNFPGGVVQVEVTAEGHASAAETIEITRQAPTFTRNYLLAPNPGYLLLTVSRPGGVLTIDGQQRPVPTGPIAVTSDVSHLVSWHAAGFTPVSRQVRVQRGETATVALQPEAIMGVLRITTTPVGARILIDGQDYGVTPKRVKLLAKEVQVEVHTPGYPSASQRVLPTPDRESLLNFRLDTDQSAAISKAPLTWSAPGNIVMQHFTPGPFTMGAKRSDPGHRANESLRPVNLRRRFYASRNEITRAQFAKLRNEPSPTDPELPQTGLLWEQAARFCNLLSTLEGRPAVYQFAGSNYRGANMRSDGYRLPTEAEWEWLARMAGRQAPTRFPWGDATVVPAGAGNFANANTQGVTFYIPRYTDPYPGLAPVGKFAANASGLFDLAGNAREWVHDYYLIIPPPPVVADPAGPTTGSDGHVIKGSSWRSGRMSDLRAAWREHDTQARVDVGFRIVRYETAARTAEAN